MRKIILSILFTLLFCSTIFAGEWKNDEHGTRYLRDDGTYATGWYQDIDGIWYFMDIDTGYLLKNTITPDGYHVNESGAWIQEEIMANKEINYDNVAEINITTLVNPLGYTVPLKVHYNNGYDNPFGGTINVLGVEVSKNGAPYISLSPKDVRGYGGVMQKYKLMLADGVAVEGERLILDYENNLSAGSPLLRGPDISEIFNSNTVISAEIWITEYEPENK